MSSFKKQIPEFKKSIDDHLKIILSESDQSSEELCQAMEYSVVNGGKRIRPMMMLASAIAIDIDTDHLMPFATAIELLHSFSLIHDDLPCMDDDEVRRGKPSTHIKYGEATAVLAGNSLLTLAFEIISNKDYKIKPEIKNDLVKSLAFCSGHSGIAGGQELDLKFENKKKNFNQILGMQKKKTGKLFGFCLYAVGALSKKNDIEKKQLSKLGEEIGLLFQLADDFLDIKGIRATVGKPIKKDVKKGKSTLINLMGYKKAYEYAEYLKKNILLKLKKHGKKAMDLTDTIEFILKRNF